MMTVVSDKTASQNCNKSDDEKNSSFVLYCFFFNFQRVQIDNPVKMNPAEKNGRKNKVGATLQR